MNRLGHEKRKAVIRSLFDGYSINATVRMTGVAKTTILRLIRDAGYACAKFHHEQVRGLKPSRVQFDEVWSFAHRDQKRAKTAPSGVGDVWTRTAIDPDSGLFLTYHVSSRSEFDAACFMLDLAGRLTNMRQLATDGCAPHADLPAFGQCDAQLREACTATRPDNARYSPAECLGCRLEFVEGTPDHPATSIGDQSNINVRGSSGDSLLTNGYCKRVEDHGHSFSMFVMYYNYARPKVSLGGRTPAIAVGLADHVWSLDELIGLIQ